MDGKVDYGFILVIILLCIFIYALIVLNSQPKKSKLNDKEDVDIENLKKIQENKFETMYICLKTVPESNDYIFRHDKLKKRKKPDNTLCKYSSVMYLCLNPILRHFYLSEDPKRMEVMKLNYIPDNFDFNAFNDRSKTNMFSDLNDTDFNKNFLPNDLAKVSNEIDNIIEDIEELECNEDDIQNKRSRNKITFKKNRISLRSLDDHYLNIKYTVFPKPEYDIAAINKNIIESVLKLRHIEIPNNNKNSKKKRKKLYYIKFLNDYYLNINKDGLLYASNDKNKIFYFDLCVLTKEQIDKFINKEGNSRQM